MFRRELPGTVRDHLYMGNFYFQSATPAHKAVLEEYRYWKHIVKSFICKCLQYALYVVFFFLILFSVNTEHKSDNTINICSVFSEIVLNINICRHQT